MGTNQQYAVCLSWNSSIRKSVPITRGTYERLSNSHWESNPLGCEEVD